jgi:hypothetical protein
VVLIDKDYGLEQMKNICRYVRRLFSIIEIRRNGKKNECFSSFPPGDLSWAGRLHSRSARFRKFATSTLSGA